MASSSSNPLREGESPFLNTAEVHERISQEESKRIIWISALVIAVSHLFFGFYNLNEEVGTQARVIANLGFSAISFAFAVIFVRHSRSQVLLLSGVVILLASMSSFAFVLDGAGVLIVYLIIPVPAFRALGLRYGSLMSASVLLIAAVSFFLTESGSQLPSPIRINGLCAGMIGAIFGFLFERAKRQSDAALTEVLQRLRILRGFISICCSCHRIKVAEDSWEQFEAIFSEDGQAEFSHGYCSQCFEEAKEGL